MSEKMKKIIGICLLNLLVFNPLAVAFASNSEDFAKEIEKNFNCSSEAPKDEAKIAESFIEQAIENLSMPYEDIQNEESDEEKKEVEVNAQTKTTIEGRVEQAPKLTLKNCIELALENNPQIKSAIYNKEIYKTQVGQAWANYFPQISAGIGYSRTKMLMPALSSIEMPPYNNFNTVNLSASQLLYDFGKTRAQVKMAKATVASTEQSLQETVNTTIYNVKSAYYNLLYAIQQEAILRNSVEIYKLHLEQAKAYYQIGTKAKIDVITAEHDLSSVQLNHIKAKNLIDVGYAQLNNAMGLPEKTNYELSDKLDSSIYDAKFEDLISKAYEMRPQLLAQEKKAQSSGYLVKASKSAFLPDLKLSASYNLGGRELAQDYGYAFGGSLEYPVVNLMLLKKQVDEAKATHNKDLADYEASKQDVYFEVKQAYISLIELQDSIPVAALALKQSKEQYDLANGRYKVGLGDAIEFKDAENAYRNSQLSYYKTLLDYNTAAGNLEKVVGAPLEPTKVPLL